jgi:hypothetical protein
MTEAPASSQSSDDAKRGFLPGSGTKQDKSADQYVPPGKVAQHSVGTVSLEISDIKILKDARVNVRNDVEGTVYPCGIDLTVGVQYISGAWFSLVIHQDYRQGKRIFSAHLENWSNTWGRWFQIVLSYED